MKRIIRIFITVLIAVIFIGTLVFLYKKSRPKTIIYETMKPFVTNLIKKTVATGSIVPRKEIEIKPQVSGIVDKIYIEPGKMVHKGDLIARVRIIPNMVALNDAESRLNRSKINLDDAKTVYDRQKKVFEQGVIPLADFQKYEVTYNNAREEVESAENNLQLIRDGVNKKMGTTTNTLIRSTIDGMVLDVPVEEGNSVIEANTFNPGTTIAFVADMGEMIFKGKVDETEVGKLKIGMKLILTIGAIENEKFDAELEYISPKGASENEAIQFEIKAKVKLKNNLFIRSGCSANGDIVLDHRDSVLAIQESLLKFQGDSPYVEIEKQKSQEFEKRFIKTGLSDGINIEVLSGLTKADKIKGEKKL
jgi:HlyD family secretion protein